MLGFKLNHVSKRGPRLCYALIILNITGINSTTDWITQFWQSSSIQQLKDSSLISQPKFLYNQVEAQLDFGPVTDIGVRWNSRVMCDQKRCFKMVKLEVYSQNDHFGLICEMIFQFLGMDWRQRIISLACFANNVIQTCPQVMLIFNREMPPGFTPAICLHHNFVYIAILENQGDKSIG